MADLTTSSAIDTFMQSANQATARTALGLGTAATEASSAFATAAQGALADTATQPGDLGDAAAKNVGTTAGTVAAGDDSRLSDSRTPTAHATSHKSGGSDAIKLDELAAPTDVTTLDATTSAHGLCPKFPGGTTNFLRADGTFAAPSGGGGGLANVTETLHTASPNNTVNAEQLEVTGGTTNAHLVLTPKGTGAFIVGQEPDGTTTGGNAPGESAIQICTVRDAATQAASGKRSIVIGARSTASVQSGIAIGANAEATGTAASIAIGGNEGNYTATCSAGGLAIHGSSTGQNAIAIGRSTAASGVGGVAIGDGASTTNSWMTYSNGNGFGGGVAGNIQSVTGSLLVVTTNATPTTMTFARYVSSFLSIPSGFVMVATCVVTCASSSGASLGAFTRRVIIKNVSGTTTLVQAQTVGTDYEDDAGLDVTITADDTNDRLKIEVTGIAATTYRWSADVRGVVYQIGT